ncbi:MULTISPECIES: hypothetical protein [Streptosporangium]|uniref:Uncharacterized protein n=1 Tax=Streptosporangium brasiliense TaxID=47480 RepID=A0ABT9RI71_9ACTN|nr:hypothetical protein [Streptosporangium brasiliense]MDP9868935.1 hypothetical protein [Streptosporangium brasiliense]
MVRNDRQSRGLAMAAVVHVHGQHCLGAQSWRPAMTGPDYAVAQ